MIDMWYSPLYTGVYVTLNLWNCPFHEIGKRIAQFVKWALCLPISRTGQYRCRFREMGIRKPAHFTKWANVVNEIHIFVHAVAMHVGAVRQGRRLYIFKVFIEYPLNIDYWLYFNAAMQKLHRYIPGASPRGVLGWTCPPHFCQR